MKIGDCEEAELPWRILNCMTCMTGYASDPKVNDVTIGKLIEVRDEDLYKEEISRIQLRFTHLNALRGSIFKINYILSGHDG